MAIKSYIKEGKKYFKVEVKSRDSFGKQVYRSKQGILSERKAEEEEFKLKKELDSIVVKGPSLFWVDWVKVCLNKMKTNSAPSTIYGYEKSLGKWTFKAWEYKTIREINRSDIHEVLYEVASSLTDNARKNVLKQIKRILQLALEDGHLDRNPAQGMSVRVAEITKLVLTNQEAEIFLRAAQKTDHPFYPIWATALMTGMRSGELKALSWSDIDFDAKTISVTKQWTSKTGIVPPKSKKNRVIPISDDFLAFLKEWKLKCDKSTDFVLPQLLEWENGEQAKITKLFCKSIAVTPIKFHDLRATFITNLLSRGVSLAKVMAIVGHSEIKTTNVYLRLAGVDTAGATNGLGYKLPVENEASVLNFRTK